MQNTKAIHSLAGCVASLAPGKGRIVKEDGTAVCERNLRLFQSLGSLQFHSKMGGNYLLSDRQSMAHGEGGKIPAVLFRQQPLLREQFFADRNCQGFKSRFPPSYHLFLLPLLFLRGLVNGLEVQRAYTPISPVNAEGYFEVLIKVNSCPCSVDEQLDVGTGSSSMPAGNCVVP